MADIRAVWLFANNILRSSRLIINEQLKPLELSSSEGNILLHLLTQDGPLPQEKIVAQLDISKPAVSRALKSLQRKGYIQRGKDPRDKRASQVQLTERAREIGPQVEQVYNNVFAIASHGVSAEEIEAAVQLFVRVSGNFLKARAGEDLSRQPA
jgi:DNA-binding MarR family transcriptional regulator